MITLPHSLMEHIIIPPKPDHPDIVDEVLVFDAETDGLLLQVTKVHVIVIKNRTTGEITRYDQVSRPLEEAYERLRRARLVYGHNILGYDGPMLVKLFAFNHLGTWVDTLPWARLTYPDIKTQDLGWVKSGKLDKKLMGKHSLKAWGQRLGILKGDFGETTDWSDWSEAMSTYCVQDVEVTDALIDKLESKGRHDDRAFWIEQHTFRIIARQMNFGFTFNQEEAQKLHIELLSRQAELLEKLSEVFPPYYKQGAMFTPKADNKRYGYKKGCSMTKIELIDFNPNSNTQVEHVLKKRHQWEPVELTPTGRAKVNDEILERLPYPEAKLIGEYKMVVKRLSFLATGDSALMDHVDEDGRIRGYVNSNGAVSGRMTHSNPNMAQIPANRNPYGKEFRGLMTVPEGYKLVGCDAEGLELRNLAHFLAFFDGGHYTHAVTKGKKSEGTDAHSNNMRAFGLDDRDLAKTAFYALIYGSGIPNFASILGCSIPKASKTMSRFKKRTKGFMKLSKMVEDRSDRGYLKGLDGRHIPIRAKHAALNALLQSAGAVIMKVALILADWYYQNEMDMVAGKDYEFVVNAHDEAQIEVLDYGGLPDYVGKVFADCIYYAGEYFDFKCPQAGAYDVGDSWAETH